MHALRRDRCDLLSRLETDICYVSVVLTLSLQNRHNGKPYTSLPERIQSFTALSPTSNLNIGREWLVSQLKCISGPFFLETDAD